MGSFSNQFTKGFTLKVEWTESGVDVATNTSDLTVTAYLVAASGYYINSTAKKNISLTINGTTYSGTCYVGLSKGETKELFKQTVANIAHNADGSKAVAISCALGIKATLNDTYFSNVSTSGTAILTTIARASQPSCVTWPEHTQNVGKFGDTISIHMNRKSSAFTHTVRYAYGTLSGTIATGVGTGVSWTIPKSFMDLIPRGTNGSGTIYVDTYNGSTLVGTKSCGFTAAMPTTADCYPKCTLALEDITGVDKIYGSPVKGLSKIKVTVNATEAYSSPIDSCVIEANGVKYDGLTATTGYLTGAAAAKATVTDGRKRTGTASYTMNVQDYSAPSVTALSVHRCDEDGTANKRGSYVKVKFSASVSSMDGKNNALYYIKYKKTSETAETTLALTEYTNQYTVSNAEYIIAASPGSSYDFAVEAVDRHNTNNPGRKSAKVSTAASIFSWRGFKTANGIEDGAGIGMVPEKPNVLQIGWPMNGMADINQFGQWRMHQGWMGMYGTVADAASSSNRKGWIGYDRGSILNIRDETGGLDYFAKGSHRWAVNGSNVMTLTNTTLRPMANDSGYVGDATYKWKAVYAVNGTIQTSDRNAKKDIVELDQRYIDLFDRLLPVSFMFTREDADRTHIGFISQDVEAAMQEVGLTDLDFAGFCRDVQTVWDEEAQEDKPVLDKNGKPVYIYSLRYTEFVALNTKLIQLNREAIKVQQAEIDTLKAEMTDLKAMLLEMKG